MFSDQQLISSFLLDRRARGCKATTIQFYRDMLRPFAAWLHTQNLTLESLNAETLRRYRLGLSETHAPGGVAAAWRAIKALLLFLSDDLDAPRYAALVRKVGRFSVPQPLLEPVSAQTVDALLATCKGHSWIAARDAALLLTLFHAGLRAREALGLNIGDLDLATGRLHLRETKGNRGRIAVLSATATRQVLRWLRYRHELRDEDPLFTGRLGRRLTYSGLRTAMIRRSKEAGLSTPILLHGLRRGWCVAMLTAGIPVPIIQVLGGWRSKVSMARYENLAGQDLASLYRRLNPFDRR
jgi:integrase/recombinase XerC